MLPLSERGILLDLTPTEAQISTIADLKIRFLNITGEAASYGVFMTVAWLATSSLISKGLRDSPPRQVLFGLTIFTLLATTTHLALHLTSLILQLPGIVMLDRDINPWVLLRKINVVQTGLRRAIYFISDAIVIWRAWAIWHDNQIVRLVLAFFLLSTFATSLSLYILNIKSILYGAHYPSMLKNFLGTFPLLITNFAATGLIAYKLWYYRANLKKYLSPAAAYASPHSHSPGPKIERVLILLIESGVVYGILWVVLMVGDFGYYGDFEMEWFQPNMSALYPVLVILFVAKGKLLSEGDLTGGSIQVVSMPLSFVHTNSPPHSDAAGSNKGSQFLDAR
ncbi:hypothetical protein MIND_00013200 [Mycena indigotica]|uniref:Uncharacterized protein n=1 Tax=Mycena indigotica TaxID=2126181 RepID=A0A8H6TCM6_9AGAR|nr:uncharacterized protein MIND_00013200 [Mycena indigotica]KAF7314991.1 hypothetical protein MIND_00013200 [Mycena indigotica]